jgi:hypothetical protein
MLRNAACFSFSSDHETGDVLKKNKRNTALATKFYKVGSLCNIDKYFLITGMKFKLLRTGHTFIEDSAKRTPLFAMIPTG